jgi:C1A family cysteine protease
MPPVGYQGSEGSCVTFAVVYETRSAEQYYSTGATSYSQSTNIFSPEYVYDQTKASTSCSSGSSMLNTLNFLFANGVCTWTSLPYSSSDGCTLIPTSSQIAEAANYKIKSYKQVLGTDQTAIKTLLSQGHPLPFAFTVDANFYTAGPGYIWNSYSSTIYGPHAITLCGYDDSKHAYRAVNHWGATWGDAGYIWIDYSFFTSVASSVYTMGL